MTSLLNTLWQGLLMTAIMWAVLRLLPRLNATTRHACWWLTFAAIAILPLRALTASSDSRTRPALSSEVTDPPAHFVSPSKQVHLFFAKAELATNSPFDQTQTNGAVDAAAWLPIQIAARPAKIALAAFWVFLSTVLSLRLAFAFRALHRLKRQALPAPVAWQSRLATLASLAGVHRPARLLVSDEITAPMALGFLSPAIIIPRSLPPKMSRPEFDHIALHELAHLRRYDDWTHLLQRLMEAVLPVQPALFWIGRQLNLEREAACDDWVVSVVGAPKTYAASLTRIAELTLWARGGFLASGAVGHPSQLYRRVQRLLDKTRNLAPKLSMIHLMLAMFAISLLVACAMNSPQVFAVADEPHAAASAPADDQQPSTQPSGPGDLVHTFTADPGDRLTMDAEQGNIHVRTWNKNLVLVAVSQNGPDLAESLKHRHIKMLKRDREVIVLESIDQGFSVPQSTQIEFTICVPGKFDAGVKDGAGNVDISHLDGKIEVTAGSGNVSLVGLKGSVNATSGDGNIDAAECAASIEAKDGSGNLIFREIGGAITAQDGDGNIDAQACKGQFDAKDGSGNITLEHMAASSFNVETGSGNVSAKFDSAPTLASTIRSGSGNISFRIPTTAAVNLVLSTGTGHIHSELPLGPSVNDAGGGSLQILKLNGGGTPIHVETGNGNIQLNKLDVPMPAATPPAFAQ